MNIQNTPGIKIIPKEDIPEIIGTEIYYLQDGKIFQGLIRSFSDNEVVIQSGQSLEKIIKYSQIIGILGIKEHISEYKQELCVSIFFSPHKTKINCQSKIVNNINGIMFYPLLENHVNYWESRAQNYSEIL